MCTPWPSPRPFRKRTPALRRSPCDPLNGHSDWRSQTHSPWRRSSECPGRKRLHTTQDLPKRNWKSTRAEGSPVRFVASDPSECRTCPTRSACPSQKIPARVEATTTEGSERLNASDSGGNRSRERSGCS